jgi:MFS family permease
VALLIAFLMVASSLPSPLYPLYGQRLGLSPFAVSLVFAAYPLGMLVALPALGGFSDEHGRRPVLIGGLAGLTASWALFALAHSLAALLLARGLQGVSTGVALGAASAALLDLEVSGDAAVAARVNGIVAVAGMGVGAMAGALLVEYAPDPLVTPFLLLATLSALMAAGIAARLPEPARAGPRGGRASRAGVPAAVRAPFALAALGAVMAWSVNAVYLALAPTLLKQLTHTDAHLASGFAIFVLALGAVAAQAAGVRLGPRRGTLAGAALLALGMALVALAARAGSEVLLVLVSVVPGAGFGLTFMSGLRLLGAAAPERDRARVMSAFFLVGYAATAAVPAAAGLAANAAGVVAAFEGFAAAVVALAAVVGRAAYRHDRIQPIARLREEST